MAISAATMALIVAGSATVAAHPRDRDDRFGVGQGRIWAPGQQGYDLRGEVWAGLGARLGMAFDGFVRRETTYQTDDGMVTQRVDSGTVSSVSEAAIGYSLANGEVASVGTDEDTQVISVSEQTVEVGRRGFSRQRLVPESIGLGDITAGSEVVVWAESGDDGTFLAQRIVIQPVTDDAADEAAVDTEADSEDATAEAAA
jgi:hypothetical protein